MAAKRNRNVSTFSDDSACSDDDYVPSSPPSKRIRRITSSEREFDVLRPRRRNVSQTYDENQNAFMRKNRCNSKNAIVARENRLKKKMYINGLEEQISFLKDENRKMKMTLSTQIGYVKELENEVKYLKSILANSKEIGSLIGSICNATGLQVNSSLNKLPSNNNNTVMSRPVNKVYAMMKPQPPIARKTAWPYENDKKDDIQECLPSPCTSISSMSPPQGEEFTFTPSEIDIQSYFSEDDDKYPLVFDDVQFSPLLDNTEIMNNLDYKYEDLLTNRGESVTKTDLHKICITEQDDFIKPELDEKCNNSEAAILEHNYSKSTDFLQTNGDEESTNNYGICLHISNKKLSLEFCSKCNEKAVTNWDAVTY